jgi:hypothetical protein
VSADAQPHAWVLPSGRVYVACGISVAMMTTMYGIVAVDDEVWAVDVEGGSITITDATGARETGLEATYLALTDPIY